MQNMLDWKKYALTFLITAAIFGTAFYLTSRLDQARVSDIRATEAQVSLDILSTETQYDLLGELSCSDIAENPGLSKELNTLSSQLSVAEQNLGAENPEVISLKKQYSLLEMKDYVLLEKIREKCNVKTPFILYFYSNTGNCPDCGRAGDVLTYLRQTYPDLRVYSFDYNLDISALQTLINIKNVKDTLPAYIIDDRAPVYGLKTVDQIEKLAPEIPKLASTTAATSTAGF